MSLFRRPQVLRFNFLAIISPSTLLPSTHALYQTEKQRRIKPPCRLFLAGVARQLNASRTCEPRHSPTGKRRNAWTTCNRNFSVRFVRRDVISRRGSLRPFSPLPPSPSLSLPLSHPIARPLFPYKCRAIVAQARNFPHFSVN